MWTCEFCGHLNDDESEICERCGMPKLDSENHRIQRECEEEMEEIESDMWDEDQALM